MSNKVSAADVAAELRRLLPGVGRTKLHKLLYYAQGHHLAHFGEPLFSDSVMAWDHGPVVASLWKAEEDGSRRAPLPHPLDTGQLNTVGYVTSRYGELTARQLEDKTHAEPPWQVADADRVSGRSHRISDDAMREFFRTQLEPPSAIQPRPGGALASVIRGAEERRAHPAAIDDPAEIERRIRALR